MNWDSQRTEKMNRDFIEHFAVARPPTYDECSIAHLPSLIRRQPTDWRLLMKLP
jgi:hypothetical protein